MIETVFFVVFGLLALLAAVGVVAQRNVLYSGLLLVVNMLSLAALYLLMNAQFVGIVQIIVYAGAVMVLFLFAVMIMGGQKTLAGASRLRGQGWLAALVVVILGANLWLFLRGGAAGGRAGDQRGGCRRAGAGGGAVQPLPVGR
jgi:NADH-quinone oxidoreductase subunit J